MTTRHRNGQLIGGVIVAGLGVLLLFERVAGFRVYDIWHLWPLILVGIGITRLAGNNDSSRRRSGLSLMIVGLWLLINTMHLFGFVWSDSWPLLLIGLGLGKLIYPEADGRSGGLLLTLIGVWTLANVLGVWGLYWDTSWPYAIIIVGLAMVFKALFERSKTSSVKETADDPS